MKRNLLVAAVAASLVMAASARADDIVLLKNGGRLRGHVLSEHPQDGVKIKLADGRTRVVAPGEVLQVIYEDQATPAAPAAPALPSQPAAPYVPAAPAPPAPPPRKPAAGMVVVNADEPGIVSIDGEPVGKAPLSKGEVPVGMHRVRVEFDAGGSAEDERVFVEANKTASVTFTVTEEEKMFRPRRGASFGAAVDGIFVYPANAPTPYGGGRLSAFLNLGLHPAVDLRIGGYGSGAAGAYGATSFPAGGFLEAVFHASRAVITVGMQGGYAPGAEVRDWSQSAPQGGVVASSTRMGPYATVGAVLGIGVALGAERRWEIGLHQELSGVAATGYEAGCSITVLGVVGCGNSAPSFVSTTSFGLTGLFFPGKPEPKTTGEVTR